MTNLPYGVRTGGVIEGLRGVVGEYGDDPDYARSRFREIDLLKDQRAHDRLKIRGLRARVEELEKIAEEVTDSESWACTDSNYNTRCDWCDYSARGFDGEHEPGCIVYRARRALRGETDGS